MNGVSGERVRHCERGGLNVWEGGRKTEEKKKPSEGIKTRSGNGEVRRRGAAWEGRGFSGVTTSEADKRRHGERKEGKGQRQGGGRRAAERRSGSSVLPSEANSRIRVRGEQRAASLPACSKEGKLSSRVCDAFTLVRH